MRAGTAEHPTLQQLFRQARCGAEAAGRPSLVGRAERQKGGETAAGSGWRHRGAADALSALSHHLGYRAVGGHQHHNGRLLRWVDNTRCCCCMGVVRSRCEWQTGGPCLTASASALNAFCAASPEAAVARTDENSGRGHMPCGAHSTTVHSCSPRRAVAQSLPSRGAGGKCARVRAATCRRRSTRGAGESGGVAQTGSTATLSRRGVAQRHLSINSRLVTPSTPARGPHGTWPACCAPRSSACSTRP